MALCRVLLVVSLILIVPFDFARGADYRSFGLEGGISFPKVLFAKAEYNFAEYWGVDYQASLGFYWAIQQFDGLYFFRRSDWSPYLGAGLQDWNFYGASPGIYNNIPFVAGNQSIAVTIPAGLLYVAANGFALDLNVALDVFVSAPSGLQGRVIPEGQLSLGYFF